MGILANENAISAGGYTIQKSLRFRASASAYLNRTPASASNRQKWTWSGWVKRGTLGSTQILFVGGQDANNYTNIYLHGTVTDAIEVYNNVAGANAGYYYTPASYRDPASWYHIMVVCDTTNAGNKISIYVNGVGQTLTVQTQITLNANTWINSANAHRIGVNQSGAAANYFDGYLAEVNFIDGQALTPSSFGSTNTLTGVWQPAKYTGTYGTNGFYLPFTNTSTTSTLVADSSGNGNNWTPNNISLTAGVTYDSMLDSPTNSLTSLTQPVGNYAVGNAINNTASGNITFSGGNLNLTIGVSAQWRAATSTISMASGKWYWEATLTNSPTGGSAFVGIIADSVNISGNYFPAQGTLGYGYLNDGNKYTNSAPTAYGATWVTSGDVIGVAFDADSGQLTFYKNGVSQGLAYTVTAGNSYLPSFGGASAIPSYAINHGQRPFTYTPPTGYQALCTTNLPDSTIVKGNQYMDVVPWVGNGATSRNITGLNFQPDFVWFKRRNLADNHKLYDVIRGVGNNKELESNTTVAEGGSNSDVYGYLSAFNSDGFSVTAGTDSSFPTGQVNENGSTYVAWQWKASGTTVSNTNGSITSTVSVNPTAGFSVVTYTGTGANATVGHGLGVAPKMVIVKKRSAIQAWSVWHTALSGTQYLVLNTTAATATLASMWNSTTPTSSVVNLGTDGNVNASTATYVAYCFAEISGYSKAFSYTANASTDGPFVYCGFRPKFVLFKCSSNADNWIIFDTSRDTYNVCGDILNPNLSTAETVSPPRVDILSNGFKIRAGSGSAPNETAGWTYIGIAFAESPFKVALAR